MMRFAKIFFMCWLFNLLAPLFGRSQNITINGSGRKITINSPGKPGIPIINAPPSEPPPTPLPPTQILMSSLGGLTRTSGATYSGGKITMVGNGTNVSVRAYHNQNLYPAYHKEEAYIKIVAKSSGNVKFGIGSGITSYGALAMIDQAGLITVPQYPGSTTYTPHLTDPGTDPINMNVGDTIHLTMEKTGKFFLVTATNLTQSKTYTNDPLRLTYFIGKPTIVCEKGTIEVLSWQYSRPGTDPKWAVFGDSFVGDGNDNPNKKWVEWLKDHITVDSIYISGRGGETSSQLLSDRFATELGWLTPQYVIISEGTNDPSSSITTATYQSNMLNMIAQVEAAGAIPILVTITRRTDINNSTFINTVNPWIRGLGKRYVDMNAATCTGEVNQIGGMFTADGVHPTAAGYEAMWNRMLTDLADLL